MLNCCRFNAPTQGQPYCSVCCRINSSVGSLTDFNQCLHLLHHPQNLIGKHTNCSSAADIVYTEVHALHRHDCEFLQCHARIVQHSLPLKYTPVCVDEAVLRSKNSIHRSKSNSLGYGHGNLNPLLGKRV